MAFLLVIGNPAAGGTLCSGFNHTLMQRWCWQFSISNWRIVEYSYGRADKQKSPTRISPAGLNSSACCNMWGCLLGLQGNALDDIAGRALGDGVLAEDLREEGLKLGAFHATICAMPRPVSAGQ